MSLFWLYYIWIELFEKELSDILKLLNNKVQKSHLLKKFGIRNY